MPQPPLDGRPRDRAGVRRARRRRDRRRRGALGARRPAASQRFDAPGGPAAAEPAGLRPGRDLAGDPARRGRRRQPRSGPAGRSPSSEPRRVPQRGARSARARCRRVVAPAAGHVQLRLRQHRGRPRPLAAPARELSRRREPHQPARRGQRFRRCRDRRRLPRIDRADPARPPGRASVRHARGHAGRPLLSGRRRVRDPGAPRPQRRLGQRRRHRGVERAAPGGVRGRWRAGRAADRWNGPLDRGFRLGCESTGAG